MNWSSADVQTSIKSDMLAVCCSGVLTQYQEGKTSAMVIADHVDVEKTHLNGVWRQ